MKPSTRNKRRRIELLRPKSWPSKSKSRKRVAEEKRVAKEKRRKAEFDRRVRLLAEKCQQEAVAKARRKEKQKAAKELNNSEDESEDESEREPGPSVPKKRRIQETVSKLNERKAN